MYTAPELLREIQKYAYKHSVSPGIRLLIDEIKRRHGRAVVGILYYGSCLQSGKETDGILDLFVVVDSYVAAYKNRVLAFLNWLLPPNVFYLELAAGDKQRIRAKYAIISLADFYQKTSEKAFHSYFWARFCQPVAIIYCHHKRIKRAIENCLVSSVITFLKATIACMPKEFSAKQLWLTGLGLSYGTEIRPERPHRLQRLWQDQGHILEAVTRAAIKHLPYGIQLRRKGQEDIYQAEIEPNSRLMCQIAWKIRRIQGKLLSVMRLFKAAVTFRGGVDYTLWKIKRHSGIEMDVNPFLRRHPWLAMLVLSWRLFKKGAVR